MGLVREVCGVCVSACVCVCVCVWMSQRATNIRCCQGQIAIASVLCVLPAACWPHGPAWLISAPGSSDGGNEVSGQMWSFWPARWWGSARMREGRSTGIRISGLRVCVCVCVCVCETHPHIWSRLCWRWSLADRCTRSYRQCWCILLHHTHQGWCCIHRYLKHTPNIQSHHNNPSVHHITGHICWVHRSEPALDKCFAVQNVFVWKDAVARCSKSLLRWSNRFSLGKN